MIREFSAKAKPSGNSARIAFFALLGCAAASVVVYMLMEHYKGIVGLLTVSFITAAVLIYSRYIGSEYYYDITFDYEGTPLFVVRQIIGQRQSTLARIGLAEITDVTEETPDIRRAHSTPHGTRKYFYTPTLLPERTVRITSVSPYERAEIVIEASSEFVELLRAYSAEARASVGTYTEE